MNSLYAELYDIVHERLRESGLSMVGFKETFCYAAQLESGVLDGNGLEKMNNQMFLESVYLGILNRLPDESARIEWGYKMDNDPDKFRQELLEAIIPSTEALLKGVCFRNEVSDKTGRKLLDMLYKIYQKFPMRLRLVLRKILRRG